MNQCRHNLGFTLLELLAATAMVAVLSASLYASLRIGFKARDAANRSVETVRRANLAMDILAGDLMAARIPNSPLATEFTGTSGGSGNGGDSLVLYAASNDQEPTSGEGDVQEIEYFCQTDDRKSGECSLVRSVIPSRISTQTPASTDEVICRGLTSFTLRYYDGTTWEDNWDSSTQNYTLPQAVEVTLRFKDADTDGGGVITRVVMLPCAAPVSSSSSSSSSGGAQ